MLDGQGILPPCKAKNRRNTCRISRFFNVAGREKAYPCDVREDFEWDLKVSLMRTHLGMQSARAAPKMLERHKAFLCSVQAL